VVLRGKNYTCGETPLKAFKVKETHWSKAEYVYPHLIREGREAWPESPSSGFQDPGQDIIYHHVQQQLSDENLFSYIILCLICQPRSARWIIHHLFTSED